MGQYYKPYLLFEDGTELALNPQSALWRTKHGVADGDPIPGLYEEEVGENVYAFHHPEDYFELFEGMKLMEHSWLGNRFVSGVMDLVSEGPARVWWVGDYSWDACANPACPNMVSERVYGRVWDAGRGGLPDCAFHAWPAQHRTGFLVNHDKGLCVDLAEHARRFAYVPAWTRSRVCVHPLPLLTACGNGRGIGDYGGTLMGSVGTWAGDRISYERSAPDWAEPASYGFQESEG